MSTFNAVEEYPKLLHEFELAEQRIAELEAKIQLLEPRVHDRDDWQEVALKNQARAEKAEAELIDERDRRHACEQHWDNTKAELVEIKAAHKKEINSLIDHLEWEHEAAAFLQHEGYTRCDCPGCNCGSWHSGKLVDELATTRAQLAIATEQRNGYALQRNDLVDELEKLEARKLLGHD